MKYAINFILALLFSALSLPGLHAQDINTERMNRDINITKNILQEMFKMDNGVRALQGSGGAFSFGSHMDISGTYLHDYGVVFSIPGRRSVFVFSSEDEDEATTLSFSYGDEGDREVSNEGIINRMKEFLRDYGSTIGQLDDGDHITLIYGNSNASRAPMVWAFSGDRKDVKKSPDESPSIIKVTARKADIEAYKRGAISAGEFDSRLNIAENDEQDTRQDLKIMANILKTSFEDAGRDTYRVRGSVNSSYIDDLGALFYLDAGYGSVFFELNAAVVKIREELKRIENDSVHVWKSQAPDHGRRSVISAEERAAAYRTFLQQLKETLVDYGRTLKSVQSDEQVIVSVSLSGGGDEVPERVDLQIKQSVLEQLDRGQTSRAQAISQISVREY